MTNIKEDTLELESSEYLQTLIDRENRNKWNKKNILQPLQVQNIIILQSICIIVLSIIVLLLFLYIKSKMTKIQRLAE